MSDEVTPIGAPPNEGVVLPRRQWVPSKWTTMGRSQPAVDPLNLPYSWVTEEVSAAMDRIVTGDLTKRRRTILMMADAVASGNRDIGDVIADDTTVSHSTWYQKMKGDEVVEEVYALALSVARHWYDQLEGHRMMKRASVVEQARDNLVDMTKVAIEVLADMLGDPDTPASVRRQLIVDVLDRADEETAAKSTHVVTSRQAPSMKEIGRGRRERPDRSAVTGRSTGAQLVIAANAGEDPEEAEFVEVSAEDGTVGD